MIDRPWIVSLNSLMNLLTCGVMILLVLTSVAKGQLVQTIDSEAQLASVLCRNAKDEAQNGLLLDKNAQFVNVTLWNALVGYAFSAQRQGSPNKSIEIYKLIVRVADRLNKPELVATTYYYLGRTYSGINDLQNSIQAYETSRKLFEQAGIESDLSLILADLGALYFGAEDYEKAQSYSERSLAIASQSSSSPTRESLAPMEYGQARSLHTLGEIDVHHGNHEKSLNKLSESLDLYERLNGAASSYNTQIAEVLTAHGKVYCEMGEYGRALSYLNKARQTSKSSGDQNTLAKIAIGFGTLFLEQEDHAVAEKFFTQSLAIFRSQRNEREETRVLLKLAVIKQRQRHYDEALHLLHRSMEGAKNTKLLDVQIAAGEGLGVVLTARRDFSNALKTINQSLELARRVNAGTREVELLCVAAQTYYEMQDYRQSASLAEQALKLARSLRLPKLTYLATAALGEAYAADNQVELAITTLKDSIDQIETSRNRVSGRQETQHLFFENKVGPYRTLVKLLIKEGKNFEALVYAERAKMRVLLEAVRSNRNDLKDALSEPERIEAQRLIDNISAISEQIQSKSSSESTSQLTNQLAAARRELSSFQERLAEAHPELQVRVGSPQRLTHTSLTALVRANEFAYLEYVVMGDDVGLFIIKRNGVTTDHELKYVSLPVSANELRRKVSEFHLALADRDPGYASLGRELYRLLIAPVTNELQNIRTICIIPDEFLWTLPFQALTTTKGTYFIQEYALFYAPSLSVLKEMALRRRQQSFDESLIAFGNPVIGSNESFNQNLHEIPETEAEVVAIARAAWTQKKRVFVGREADEKRFKALAPQYATIHLATHGVLDNGDPLNSHLLLTKTDGDMENDGLLQAREIINMRLDADLAVLSACQTGNGRISPGEGLIGMSWAFFVAGARSVVVSQWRVNSHSTSQLMKNFYHALTSQIEQDNQNKSQALREASLRLLKDRRYRHPFYWAGFVLVSSN